MEFDAFQLKRNLELYNELKYKVTFCTTWNKEQHEHTANMIVTPRLNPVTIQIEIVIIDFYSSNIERKSNERWFSPASIPTQPVDFKNYILTSFDYLFLLRLGNPDWQLAFNDCLDRILHEQLGGALLQYQFHDEKGQVQTLASFNDFQLLSIDYLAQY